MKLHVNTTMLKSGAVLFAATFAGIAGAKAGMREFEKLVPRIENMVTVTRVATSILGEDEDDEFEEDYDD